METHSLTPPPARTHARARLHERGLKHYRVSVDPGSWEEEEEGTLQSKQQRRRRQQKQQRAVSHLTTFPPCMRRQLCALFFSLTQSERARARIHILRAQAPAQPQRKEIFEEEEKSRHLGTAHQLTGQIDRLSEWKRIQSYITTLPIATSAGWKRVPPRLLEQRASARAEKGSCCSNVVHKNSCQPTQSWMLGYAPRSLACSLSWSLSRLLVAAREVAWNEVVVRSCCYCSCIAQLAKQAFVLTSQLRS